MKLARFSAQGRVGFGVVEGEEIVELSESYFKDIRPTKKRHALNNVRLLAPTEPTKVICVGVNYRGHAQEMGHQIPEDPCLFLKPETSVIGPGEAILYPPMSKQVDYEAELAAVIARPLWNVTPAEAMRAVLGYTCVNDVTARDLQRKDGQWTRAKGFNTFCPIGPWIDDEIDPDSVDVELLLNRERRQFANTQELIHKMADLLSYVSRIMTLRAGDVVATGTPAGIGPMKPGDDVEVRISGIGSLKNHVELGA